MNKKWHKIVMGILVLTLGLSVQIRIEAIGNFKLPAAGMSLLLDEGISMGDISSNFEVEPINLETASVTTKSVDELLRTSTVNSEEEMKEDFSDLVIAKVDKYVNVRAIASESGGIVGKLYNNSVGKLIIDEGEWVKIESGNVIGYVKKEFVVLGAEAERYVPEIGMVFATVNSQTLFIRKSNSLSAEIIGMCPEGEELLVTSILDDWVKVDVEAGVGYVASEYVTIHTEFVQAESSEEEEIRLAKEEQDRLAAREAAERIASINEATVTAQNEQGEVESVEQEDTKSTEIYYDTDDMGAAIVAYATQFLGNPYVYGGTSLTNGTDCSGFTQSLYKNFGVEIPRTSTSQRTVGAEVEGLENALPGDLICYSGHVALYAGNGNIIHASNAKTGIIMGTADYRTILSIRRIF